MSSNNKLDAKLRLRAAISKLEESRAQAQAPQFDPEMDGMDSL